MKKENGEHFSFVITYFQSDAYVATLKCFYENRNSPYLILMPAKVEQAHHDPQILLFHDAIREKDIERLKAVAMPKVTNWLYVF